MMRLSSGLLLCLFLLTVPAAHALQLDLSQGHHAGVIAPDETLVLVFPSEVDEALATRGITASARSGELGLRVRVAGTRVVVQAVRAWPVDQTVAVDLAPALRRSLRGGDTLPATLRIQVRPADLFQEVGEKPGSTRQTAVSNGNLDNGIEVFPLPFTPNDDGFNDVLHITRPGIGFVDPAVTLYSIEGITVASLDIENLVRGEMIWNGETRLGQEARPGPYFIIIEDAGEVLASGVIYILR